MRPTRWTGNNVVAVLCAVLCCSIFVVRVTGQCSGTILDVTQNAGYIISTGEVVVPSPPPAGLDNFAPELDYVTPSSPQGTTCRWRIIAPEGHIELHWHDYQLGPGGQITVTSVSATTTYLGNNDNNQELPESIVLSDSGTVSMLITYTSGSTSKSRFLLYWLAGSCMKAIAVFTREQGMFSDGSGPLKPYLFGTTCGFLITSSNPRAVIQIDITYEYEATFDSMQAFDGDSVDSPVLARFSTTTTTNNPNATRGTAVGSGTYLSTTGSMYIYLLTDKNINYSGFELTYQILTSGRCSHVEITQSAGVLSDQSGIANYLPNQECSWLLTAESDRTALFFDYFDLADDDFLYVYAGNGSDGQLLSTLSGSSLPRPVIYDGPEALYLEFVTNSKNSGQGFSVVFQAGTCFGTTFLREPNGVITDGSGSAEYRNQLDCGWLLQVDPEIYEYIEFNVTMIDTEFIYDKISIMDGTTVSSTVLVENASGKKLPGSGKTSGSSMLVTFKTDDDTARQGWEITYRAVKFPPDDVALQSYTDGITLTFLILLLLTGFFILLALVALVLGGIFASKRIPMFIATGLSFNIYLLVILALACLAYFPFIDRPTIGLCTWRAWVSLAWIAIFVAIVSKMYWIWVTELQLTKEEKKTVIQPKYGWPFITYFLFVNAFALALEVVFLIVWTIVDRPMPEREETTLTDQFYDRCRSEHHGIWIGIQYAYIGILVVIGLIASVRLFNMTVLWSESKIFALTVVLVAVSSAAFLVILYLLEDVPYIWYTFLGFGIWTQILIVLATIYLTKVFILASSKYRKVRKATKKKLKRTVVGDNGEPGPERRNSELPAVDLTCSTDGLDDL